MPPLTATAPHPLFVLPHDRSRTYLNWARWLALAEGIILLLGAAMMISRGGFSAPAVGLGILSLTLGWQVGRGSPHAAVILLGLSISRGVMTLVPGAPEWWTTFPLLTLLELFVFAQAARGSIALAEPSSQSRTLVRNFLADCLVVAIIGPLAFAAMTIHVAQGEGVKGMGEGLIVLIGVLHFLMTIALLVSGALARSGKQRAQRARAVIYVMFLGEAMLLLKAALAPSFG